MQISIKHDLKRVERTLTDIQRKQIPFAASKAINDTAFDLRKQMGVEVGNHIDRPTPFTKKGFQVRKSTKANLTGAVFIPANRWKYMKYAVEGGSEGGGNVPVNASMNAYGSMRRNYLKGVVASKTGFAGEVRGKPGVWRRTGRKGRGGVKLIASFPSNRKYRTRFDYQGIGYAYVRRVFPGHMNRALARALATAK